MKHRTALSASILVAVSGTAALAQPADLIANAPRVVVATTYNGTTVGATNDGISSCGFADSSPDVWVKFIPGQGQGGSNFTFSTCTSSTALRSFNTVLSIHTGATPELARNNPVQCNDNGCLSQSTVTLTNAVLGQTYWIRIAGGNNTTGAFALAVSGPPSLGITVGPDIVVYENIDVANYTTTAPVSGMFAYAVGTTSCNPGDYPAEWIAGNNLHPVIAQNMYRLANGRFDHVGKSYVKHGFASVNGNQCGTCVQPPNGGSQLGVNCSDPYGSGLNGSQTGLGPRSQINATTGEYVYTGNFTTTGTPIDRRLQVPSTYIAGRPAGSRFFVDSQYISQDDAQFNNGLNNSSFRELVATNITGSSNIPFTTFGDAGGYRKGKTGLFAWKLADPTVKIVNADYTVNNPRSFPLLPASVMPASITARFHVATKVTANTGPLAGTWHYEYVVQNLNSDRSGGTFTIPMPANANVQNIGFNAPPSHSGEPYSNAAWTSSRVGNTMVWSTQTFAENQNANAIRWSTAYTFRFDADVAPSVGDVKIGFFKPGPGTEVIASAVDVPTVPPACIADISGGGASGDQPDGTVDGSDFIAFINSFGIGDATVDAKADVAGGGTNGDQPDGTIDGSDFIAFINAFGVGC
jgi:hypothetical protein